MIQRRWFSNTFMAAGVCLALTGCRPSGDAVSATQDRFKLIPSVPFTDITSGAGIDFVHRTGATGEKLLPETMGGGCAFFDFNNDGHQDLLFVDSGDWPWTAASSVRTPTLVLYANDGTGQFRNVTKETGLQTQFYGMGVAVGDFDNDGFVDIFATGVGENHLFRNRGGRTFENVTATVGLATPADSWGTSAAWVDYDNDGDLDLFVCNYVRWSRELDGSANYELPEIGRAYGPPMNFQGAFSTLYRNDGSAGFKDVSSESGIQVVNRATGHPLGKGLGIAPVDLDQDGWIDLIVANDTVQNFVFHNQKDGTFKEIGAISGLAFDNYGKTRGAMGIDSNRLPEKNELAIAIGNFANEMTALYVSQKEPFLFSDEAIQQGIGTASRSVLTFGVFFFDYDLDGWTDLLTVNGHIEPRISDVFPGQRYRQSAQLFWNAQGAGGRGYLPVPEEKCGPDLFQPLAGRGSAFADIDSDGDLDLVLTQVGGPAVLLRNDRTTDSRWVRVKAVGTSSNRDAIGAWVHLRVGQRTLSRQVMPTRGYLSQSELPVTFGLGPKESIQELAIVWPGGNRQVVGKVEIGRVHVIRQAKQ